MLGRGADMNCPKTLNYLRKATRLGNTDAKETLKRIQRHQDTFDTACVAGAFLNLFGESLDDSE